MSWYYIVVGDMVDQFLISLWHLLGVLMKDNDEGLTCLFLVTYLENSLEKIINIILTKSVI